MVGGSKPTQEARASPDWLGSNSHLGGIMNTQDTPILLSRYEAQILQDILRHISTSNQSVVDATFEMFYSLQTKLDVPRRSCVHCVDECMAVV